MEDLKAKGRIDITLHCSEDGNYDILQCDSGVCWCADEITGEALGEVVPQPMMEMLPCREYLHKYLTYTANSLLLKFAQIMRPWLAIRT